MLIHNPPKSSGLQLPGSFAGKRSHGRSHGWWDGRHGLWRVWSWLRRRGWDAGIIETWKSGSWDQTFLYLWYPLVIWHLDHLGTKLAFQAWLLTFFAKCSHHSWDCLQHLASWNHETLTLKDTKTAGPPCKWENKNAGTMWNLFFLIF